MFGALLLGLMWVRSASAGFILVTIDEHEPSEGPITAKVSTDDPSGVYGGLDTSKVKPDITQEGNGQLGLVDVQFTYQSTMAFPPTNGQTIHTFIHLYETSDFSTANLSDTLDIATTGTAIVGKVSVSIHFVSGSLNDVPPIPTLTSPFDAVEKFPYNEFKKADNRAFQMPDDLIVRVSSAVPEPGSLTLLVTGLTCLIARSKRLRNPRYFSACVHPGEGPNQ
jgi:hypothetical protein